MISIANVAMHIGYAVGCAGGVLAFNPILRRTGEAASDASPQPSFVHSGAHARKGFIGSNVGDDSS
jgi:hypothetical protein